MRYSPVDLQVVEGKIEQALNSAGVSRESIESTQLLSVEEVHLYLEHWFTFRIKHAGVVSFLTITIPARNMSLWGADETEKAIRHSLYKLTPKYKIRNHEPNWIEFYIGLSIAVSKKSKDTTKHGCIITDEYNKILGLGFNGFPEGFPDDEMPTHRDRDPKNSPNKYTVTPHAEVNAVTNCQHKPVGGIAYIDGRPCAPCLIHLYQNGIRKVFCLDRTSVMLDEYEEKAVQFVVEKSKKSSRGELEVFFVKPSLKWLSDLGEEVKNGVY